MERNSRPRKLSRRCSQRRRASTPPPCLLPSLVPPPGTYLRITTSSQEKKTRCWAPTPTRHRRSPSARSTSDSACRSAAATCAGCSPVMRRQGKHSAAPRSSPSLQPVSRGRELRQAFKAQQAWRRAAQHATSSSALTLLSVCVHRCLLPRCGQTAQPRPPTHLNASCSSCGCRWSVSRLCTEHTALSTARARRFSPGSPARRD